LTCYLRSKIWQCFKLNLHTPSSEKLLGCSRAFFISYIKSRLVDGMTMENYGRVWQLDHIIPCKKFNLHLKKDRLKCFDYTNYQPMFAHQNAVKQGRAETQKLLTL